MKQIKKILVVDDEKVLVQLCRIILEAAGFEVFGAYNGNQALTMTLKEMPDLILLDVMMPGLDGIEVCRQIRETHNLHLPIIMYTADERDVTRRNSMAAGATGVLTKETPIYEIPDKIGIYLEEK